jgi:hypothetical protein
MASYANPAIAEAIHANAAGADAPHSSAIGSVAAATYTIAYAIINSVYVCHISVVFLPTINRISRAVCLTDV